MSCLALFRQCGSFRVLPELVVSCLVWCGLVFARLVASCLGQACLVQNWFWLIFAGSLNAAAARSNIILMEGIWAGGNEPHPESERTCSCLKP